MGALRDVKQRRFQKAFVAHLLSAVGGIAAVLGLVDLFFIEVFQRSNGKLFLLVILAAVPEAATNGMLEVSGDQAQRLTTQVAGMGNGELTRAAEVIATGLTEMRGTTAPRLHLELMCARVLLPGADADERGLHARMDRLERRVGMIGAGEPEVPNWDDVEGPTPVPRTEPASAPATDRARPEVGPARTRPTDSAAPAVAAPPVAAPSPPPTQQRQESAPQRPKTAPAESGGKKPLRQRPAGAPPGGSAAPPAPAAGPQQARPRAKSTVELTTAELRRVWPNVLEEVKGRRRFTFMLLSQNAQVMEVADGQLVLGFANAGARENFATSGNHDVLADSLIEVIGVELRIQAVLSKSGEQAQAAQVAAPQPQAAPPPPPATRQMSDAVASAASATEPEMESGHSDISSDDAELVNAEEAAAALLTETFAAEIIDVTGRENG